MRNGQKKDGGQMKLLQTIESARELPPEKAVGLLITCLKKSSSLVGEQAIHALSELDAELIIAPLIETYQWFDIAPKERDHNCALRQAIVKLFFNIETAAAIPILKKAIHTVQIIRQGPQIEDAAIELRAAAAIALAQVDPYALYDLSMLLFDMNPDVRVSPSEKLYVKAPVRKAAARAIGILGNSAGVIPLGIKLKYSNDELHEVVAECIESVASLRPHNLIEILEPYLLGIHAELAAITAFALAESLGEEALEILYVAYDKAISNARDSFVLAMARIRSHKVKQVLLEFLDDDDPKIRKAAVQGMKYHIDADIQKRLLMVSQNDPDSAVRLEAADL